MVNKSKGASQRKTKREMKKTVKSTPAKMPTKQVTSITPTPEKDSVISGFRLKSQNPVGLYRTQEEQSRGIPGTQASFTGMPYIKMKTKEQAFAEKWLKEYKGK